MDSSKSTQRFIPARGTQSAIPQSFISHNAITEPAPPKTLAGLTVAYDDAHAATDQALADPNLPAGAVEIIATGGTCPSVEIEAVGAWIRLEHALAAEHQASKSLANFQARHSEAVDAI
jgi:hypothetical protein